MPNPIPRNRVPLVAAWLAAEGHTLMTAPPSLVASALRRAEIDPVQEVLSGGWAAPGRLGLDSTNQAP